MKNVIKRKVLETIIKAFNTSSNDETRYYLQSVKLTKDFIESTDGHILTKITLQDKLNIESDLLIDSKAKNRLSLFLKENKSVPSFEFTIQDRSLTLSSGNDSVLLPLLNAQYPDTSKLLPDVNSDNYYTIKFNPDFIKRLYDSMSDKDKHKSITLKVKKDGSMSPILVSTNNDLAIGLLMPLRG